MFYTCTTIVLPVVQKHSASIAKELQDCENVLGHHYICCFGNGIMTISEFLLEYNQIYRKFIGSIKNPQKETNRWPYTSAQYFKC